LYAQRLSRRLDDPKKTFEDATVTVFRDQDCHCVEQRNRLAERVMVHISSPPHRIGHPGSAPTEPAPKAGSPKSPVRVKPRLRGVSHEITFYMGLLGAALLVSLAPAGRATWAALVYGLSFVTLFGISALYHRPMWQPKPRKLMRRLDHSGIYLLIAGTYTPVTLLALDPAVGDRLLAVVWIGAGLGIVQAVLKPDLPRKYTAGLYVLLGWALVSEWSAVVAGIGTSGVALLLGGGLLYSVGALIYATKRPDPWPRVFGYHEIFHLLVIGAACAHATLVVRLTFGFAGS
jgi:hemolysin III